MDFISHKTVQENAGSAAENVIGILPCVWIVNRITMVLIVRNSVLPVPMAVT